MDRPHAVIALVAGCAGAPPSELETAQLAFVIDAPTASDAPFHDPALAEDGVRGGGRWSGSLDVLALGPGADEGLVLGFDPPVRDGEGPDLAVFENPFDVQGGGRFFDPVVVEVSADCEGWRAFPHAHSGPWSADPSGWVGFAGLEPVLLHEEDHPVDPLGPDAGGDAFDLAELPDAPAEVACVRLTSASAWTDAAGEPYPADPVSDGPDIDGVYGRH